MEIESHRTGTLHVLDKDIKNMLLDLPSWKHPSWPIPLSLSISLVIFLPYQAWA
jgi:hypothetical protein